MSPRLAICGYIQILQIGKLFEQSKFVRVNVRGHVEDVKVIQSMGQNLGQAELVKLNIVAVSLLRRQVVEFEFALVHRLDQLIQLLQLFPLLLPFKVPAPPLAHNYHVRRPSNRLLHALQGVDLHRLHVDQHEVDYGLLGEDVIHAVQKNSVVRDFRFGWRLEIWVCIYTCASSVPGIHFAYSFRSGVASTHFVSYSNIFQLVQVNIFHQHWKGELSGLKNEESTFGTKSFPQNDSLDSNMRSDIKYSISFLYQFGHRSHILCLPSSENFDAIGNSAVLIINNEIQAVDSWHQDFSVIEEEALVGLPSVGLILTLYFNALDCQNSQKEQQRRGHHL